MPILLTIADLVERFPEFRAAVLLFSDIAIPPVRSSALADRIAGLEQDSRDRHRGSELSAIPGVAAWRSAYKGFGIKKTSYRSSVERLVKRVLAGDAIPAINPFVDIYNAVSLDRVFCIGADDLDRIKPPVAFRFAQEGDTFKDMAGGPDSEADDPPKPGEVVLADARHVLCRRWNWRQDTRSAIGPDTTRALLTIQSNGWGDVGDAAAALADWVKAECGGMVVMAIAQASRPTVELG